MANRALSLAYQITGVGVVVHPYGVGYRLLITGTPDYDMGVSSFTLLQNDGRPSFLQLSGPFTEELVSILEARPDEEIVVSRAFLYSDGTQSAYEDLFRANYESVSFSRGALSQSMSMRASKQTTNQSPKTIALTQIKSEELQADGKKLWKVPLATSVKAGDSVIVGEVTYKLESARWYVTPQEAWLDLKEA